MSQLVERFVIGHLGKPRGLKGELKVFPLTDDVKRFKKLKKCYLEDAAGNIHDELNVAFAHIANHNLSIAFSGITNREQAENLKGLYLSIDRAEAIELEEDTYFIADLIGCSVYDQEHGYLGKISRIQSNVSADIVIVHDAGKNDLLYPNLKSIVKHISIAERRIDLILPEGLYEIYREA